MHDEENVINRRFSTRSSKQSVPSSQLCERAGPLEAPIVVCSGDDTQRPHSDASVRVRRNELSSVWVRQRRVKLTPLIQQRVRRQRCLEVGAAMPPKP